MPGQSEPGTLELTFAVSASITVAVENEALTPLL